MRHATFDWNAIEPRIRPHVKALRDAGYETTGSCGHEMWITIDLKPMELPALHETLRRLGYKDFEITYSIHEGFQRWEGARVQFGGDLEGDGKPFDLVLLKVDPEAHPLYFVIRARNSPDSGESVEERASGDQYFYDEHTCPTNWTNNIIAVISDGDEDPHGFATFVRRRDAPPDMDESGDIKGIYEGPLWATLFPEVTAKPSESP